MSTESPLLRSALKRHLVPALAAMGFAGRSSAFQRIVGESQDLLAIQYWKYGGSFILEFGRRSRGPLHTSWGEVVPEAAVTVAHLPVTSRARLLERDRKSDDSFGGFSFAGLGDDPARYDALALRVAALLPQVDAWLGRGEVGSDVLPFDGC